MRMYVVRTIYSATIVCAVMVGIYVYAHTSRTGYQESAKADCVIFSYDRPLQLYALLESIATYVTGIGEMRVIYRASNEAYVQAYKEVSKIFTNTYFIRQGDTPALDFKPLTVQAVFGMPHKYIIFAVDDNVVKDQVHISECITMLERTNAYGFYLRLGKNLTACYSESQQQALPVLKTVTSDVYSWCFANSTLDWKYPHSVDMTLYRKKDIEHDIRSLEYHSPNILESYWASRAGSIMHRCGLCYAQTKVVNIPLNRVQTIWNNRSMNYKTPDELLEVFNKGMKIDIKPLYKIVNASAHMEYVPTFITR